MRGSKAKALRRATIATGERQSKGWVREVTAACTILGALTPVSVWALPQDGTIAAGSATISSPTSTTMRIDQNTDRVVIDWARFNIAANEAVRFQQPSAASIALNRVAGYEASGIFGSLSANGQIIISNPSGILFGPSSRVDVGALTATTLNITNQDFLAGQYRFTQDPVHGNAAVVNQGIIAAGPGGYVALLGAAVSNEGLIQAQLGTVALGAAKAATLDMRGDGKIGFVLTDAVSGNVAGPNGENLASYVSNTGTIRADGGMVTLTARAASDVIRSVVNHEGVIEARSLEERNGQVFLNGGDAGIVSVSGTVDASGAEKGQTGGTVQVVGDRVGLFGAHINVAGDAGGGTALVGGDYQGHGTVPNATRTYVSGDSTITADALTHGNGGKIIVWADDTTRFDGNISARGGAQIGNGGFVEVSGKQVLDYRGLTDLTAPAGATGTLLLDPNNLTISISASANISTSGTNPLTDTTTNNSAVLQVATLQTQLGSASVIVQTGAAAPNSQNGDLTVANAIAAPANANSLTLRAHNNLAVNANIDFSASSGNLTLQADSDANAAGAISRTGAATTILMGSGSLALSAGSGIGTSATPLLTSGLTNVAARTGTGGIFLQNSGTGNINITAINDPTIGTITGLSTTTGTAATAGNIQVNQTAAATITVSSPIVTAANAAGSTGAIQLTTTNGAVALNANLTTGNAAQADASGSQFTSSGNITVTAGGAAGNITGNGQLTTGSATLTGANAGGADSATSGNISLTAGGGMGLSNPTALQTGTATRTVAVADIANAGTITLTSANEINNGTSSTALGLSTGLATGAATNNPSTVTVTTTGATGNIFITSPGALRMGAVTTAAGSAQTVDLRTTGSNTLTLTATGATANDTLVMNSGGALALNAALSAATASLTATGTITQTGALTVTGATTIAAGSANDITLNNAGNNFNSVAITSGNNVTLVDTNAIVLGTSTVSGVLNVTAAGTITDSGNLVVAGTTTLAAGAANNITLDNANNFSSVAITSGNNVTLNDTNALNLGNATAAGTLTAIAGGTITLNGTVSANSAGTSITLASGGNFINNVGATALNPGAGRWLVYSANPASDTRGGLVYNFKQYNATFGVTTVLGTGNGFLYTTAPIITPSLTGTVTKVYDGTTTVNNLVAGNYAVSGAIDGDTVTLNNPPSGTYNNKNVGTNKNVSVSNLSISSATDGAATVFGYQLGSSTANANIGVITAHALTLTALTNTKTYDGTTTAVATPTVAGLQTGDSVTGLAEAYANKNAGTGKTLAVSTFTVNDGNGGNNYTVSTVDNTTGVINQAALTLTALTNTKTYDGTTTAAATPTVAGLQTGDSVTGLAEAYANKNAGTGKTLAVSTFTVNDGNGGNNYTVSTVDNTTGVINQAALTLTALTNTKTYDGTTTAAATPTVAGLQTGDSVTGLAEAYANKNAGTGKTLAVSTFTVNDGNGGNNYTVSTVDNTTGVINQAALTLTALTNTKTYDGTTTAAATPTVAGLQTGDSVTGLAEAYANKNAGTGKTLAVSTFTVNDGNGGNNYTVSTVDNTTGVINQAALTLTALTNTKTYDGTTTAAATPTVAGLQTGDSVTGLAEAYANKNAGTGKTLAVSTFTVNDGNGGNNYTVSTVDNTTGVINQAALTLTALTNTKTYDGTTTAAATPTVAGLQTGDSVTGLAEAYANKNAGTGKTLAVSTFTVNDGNGGNNYTVSTVDNTTGVINQAALTLTALTNTKTYDGTTTAVATPTVAGLQTGDSVTGLAEAYANKNAGTGKTLAVSTFTVNDGNGGNNYTVSTVDNTTGVINQAALTLTALTNTKTYDGTTTAAATPTVAGLQTGDSVTGLAEAYANKNAGTGKTLAVSTFTVNDGNGGNNYTVSTVDNTTGVINQAALTLTALTNTKTYDGTTTAAATPTVAGLQTGDSVTGLAEAYANKNAGTGKTLAVSTFTVNDGNGGNNYTVSTVDNTTGVINQAALTLTALTNTKTYDGTTTAAATPTVAGLQTGDSVTGLAEAYANKNAGTGKTLAVSTFTVNDGNGGNNYTVSTVDNTTGVINQAALTLTALTNTKTYDGTTTAAATPTVAGLQTGDSVTGLAEAYANKNAGTGKTLAVSTFTVNDGNGGNNYTVSTVDNTTGVINQAALTLTALTNTKTYDGTTTAVATPTVAGLQTGDSVTGLAEAYANKNAGTGKTLAVSTFTVNDGNGGNNYTVSTVDNTTGVINQAALTLTALTNTKTYDGTTTAVATPTVAGLQTGDSVTGLAEAYANKNAGTGKTLAVSTFTVNDGNGGNNYTVSTVDNTTGVINQAALTLTALTNTKTYDGTTTAVATPTVAGLQTGDSVTGLAEAYANKNAGTGKTLAVSTFTVNDGNGGNNYTVSTVDNTTGVINQAALTLTALTNTKTYDGTTTAAATPTVAGLQTGDSVTGLAEAYANKNAGTGKTLAVSTFTVNDGNGGNNYTVSTVDNTTGVINQAALTLTALTNTKTYDGTTTAAATPTVAGLQTGDSVTGLAEAYANKNAGTGKTLAVSTFTVNDGNGGNNYTVSTVDNTTGVINQAALTLTALTNTKTYDGTTTAAATPTVAGLQTGDSVTGLAEAYANKNAGTGKTLAVSTFTVNDGNGGNNYTVSTVDNTTGVINQAALTLTALTNTKTYDGTTTAAATPTVAGLQTGDSVTGLAEAYANKNAGTGKTLAVSTFTVNDGNGGNNYTVSTVDNTTGVINQAALTLTALTNTKTYDGTTTAAATPTVAGLQTGDSVTGLAEAYANKNVLGTNGSTLIVNPGLVVNDGNGGANYNVTLNTAAGTITPAGLTVTANDQSKIFGATFIFTGTEFTPAGLQNGETIGSVTLTSAGAPAAATVAGSPYTITASSPTGGTFATGNYSISFMPGALTVNPALTLGGAGAPLSLGTSNLETSLLQAGILESLTNKPLGPATLLSSGILPETFFRTLGCENFEGDVCPSSQEGEDPSNVVIVEP